jgi:simple sugar transport system ATP-binding protein
MSTTTSAAALDLRAIDVHYGYVKALNAVDFHVAPGEAVSLLGDNGAGKSTLLKVMSGAHRPSGGEILVRDQQTEFRSPKDARSAGIEMVYQDLALVDALDTATNLTLGREILRKGPLGWLDLLDRKKMRAEAAEEIARLGVKIGSLSTPVEMLSGGQRQGVALARGAVRVLANKSGILLLDEPTAALGYEQKLMVERLIGRLTDDGIAVVLVTHDLPLAFSATSRMAVLNRGRKVADIATADTTMDQIVGWITGSLGAQPGLEGVPAR